MSASVRSSGTRSRADSKHSTVAAIATFSDSAGPCIGTQTRPSRCASSSPGTPWASLPSTTAVGREVDLVVGVPQGVGAEAPPPPAFPTRRAPPPPRTPLCDRRQRRRNNAAQVFVVKANQADLPGNLNFKHMSAVKNSHRLDVVVRENRSRVMFNYRRSQKSRRRAKHLVVIFNRLKPAYFQLRKICIVTVGDTSVLLVLAGGACVSYLCVSKFHQMTHCHLGCFNIIRNDRRAGGAANTIDNHIRKTCPFHLFDGFRGTFLKHYRPVHFPRRQFAAVLRQIRNGHANVIAARVQLSNAGIDNGLINIAGPAQCNVAAENRDYLGLLLDKIFGCKIRPIPKRLATSTIR